MADNGNEFLEIAAIWENTSKSGKTYYSGSLGKTRILMFPIDSDNPKSPKFRICLAARSEEDGGYQKKGSQGNQDNAFSKKEPDMDRTDDGPRDGDIPF